jgi:xylitol oxidase
MTTAAPALTNWAGNIVFRPAAVHRPCSVAEVQALVAGSSHLRVLGSGHSFNRIADTPGDLLVLDRMAPTVEIDTARAQARVAGAVRYGELAHPLHAAGFALPNTGSLPHISVAGACATGTHGSGVGNQVLATHVAAVELVRADGELVTLRRGEPGFEGAALSLGALGVVTHLVLDLVPTFDVRQVVQEGLTRAGLQEHLDEVMGSAYSVSVFTDHRAGTSPSVWQKHTGTTAPPGWLGTHPADGPRHPVPGEDPAASTTQGAVAGPWHERLPHFRLDFTPSSGEELQSEYFVPREHGRAALGVLADLAEEMAPLLMISELRTVAADDLWLSPAQGRDSLALHFTWFPDTAGVTAFLPRLEQRLAELDARPHWGKVNTVDPEVVRGLFPRLEDARALVHEHDPSGTLRNELVERYLR